MLFVLAGYGGSLYDIWMNGVWGEAKQERNPPGPYTRPAKERSVMTKGINGGSKSEAEMESAIKLFV